jgi:hypothetical protein
MHFSLFTWAPCGPTCHYFSTQPAEDIGTPLLHCIRQHSVWHQAASMSVGGAHLPLSSDSLQQHLTHRKGNQPPHQSRRCHFPWARCCAPALALLLMCSSPTRLPHPRVSLRCHTLPSPAQTGMPASLQVPIHSTIIHLCPPAAPSAPSARPRCARPWHLCRPAASAAAP